jgi:hypothetical protein
MGAANLLRQGKIGGVAGQSPLPIGRPKSEALRGRTADYYRKPIQYPVSGVLYPVSRIPYSVSGIPNSPNTLISIRIEQMN